MDHIKHKTNNFWSLTGFEFKKILHKKSVIITFSFSLAYVIFTCFIMVMGSSSQGDYYTENRSAYEAMLMDKEYEKALEGRPLDSALILEASAAYQKIDKNVSRYTESKGYQTYARPYASIYGLIDAAYVSPGNAFNVDDFQTIAKEDADQFYAIRANQYRANLTNNPLFSDSDVEKIMDLDQAVCIVAFILGFLCLLAAVNRFKKHQIS